MADILSPKARSRNMARIKGRDTEPELVVRRILRSLGVGYRLHCKLLPGRPDIAMPGRKKAIEVRGCFWHRHQGCRLAYVPKSRVEFWTSKFERNVARDGWNERALQALGFDLLIVWECETSDTVALAKRVAEFVGVERLGKDYGGR